MSDLPYSATNRRRWDELTGIHARSAFYDVDGFRAGKCTLRPLEVGELGDVAGKTLLHLQCHFGLDSLSWARRGARVTGVDFSEEAVALARSLAHDCGLDAKFICSDLYELPGALAGEFDVVFTSYGVLCWLPDLRRWAEIAARYLKPGGTFYIAEIHPLVNILEDAPGAGNLRVAYPYFHSAEPMRWEATGTYADRTAAIRHTVSYEWSHPVGDILNALLVAGLAVEFLHEFPYCVCSMLPGMEQGPDGWWRLTGQPDKIPFLFSLKARKPNTNP
jgi:SAM-dependent methyltransferase